MSDEPYVVAHIVANESTKDLIGPQVVDHMEWQRTADGGGRPSAVSVMLLEPVRVAMRGEVRSRVNALRSRAPELPIDLVPYVSRLGVRRNSKWIAGRARRFARGRRIVFHCRGESAAEWALAMRAWLPGAAVVSDIRGAWPEELLYQRGFDGPEGADAVTLTSYRANVEKLRHVLQTSGAVLSVSSGMLSWLESMGADPTRLHYVPCCVPDVTFNPAVRAHTRQSLGLEDRFVFVYLGTITRYQHIDDGVLPFFRALAAEMSHAHLLCITPQVEQMRELLMRQRVEEKDATVISARQADVAPLLMGADAGFILRAPSRMNAFSQPTKLAEYLAAGVPILVSRGTGQVPELVESAGAGIGVCAFGLSGDELQREARRVAERLFSEAEAFRRGAVQLAQREFLWSDYTDRVRGAYAEAIDSSIAVRTD